MVRGSSAAAAAESAPARRAVNETVDNQKRTAGTGMTAGNYSLPVLGASHAVVVAVATTGHDCWSLVVSHWSSVIGRWSLVVDRWSLVARREALHFCSLPTQADRAVAYSTFSHGRAASGVVSRE